MPLLPEGKYIKVGAEIGWLGFPAIASWEQPCFFTGAVSAWIHDENTYLVDGVAINGVSGGPAFVVYSAVKALVLMGVVSAYIPNKATGETLPGLSVIMDVEQFQELAKEFKSLEEAAEKAGPGELGEMHRIIMAPRGIPADRLAVLREAFVKLQGDKTYKRMMKRLGEDTNLMDGDKYEMERPKQSEAYKKLVDSMTKG